MYREEIVLKIKPLFSDYLEKGGFVLVDLRFFKARGELIFEVLIDRSEGGITLDECTRLNRELGNVLDASGYIQESYALDVSSPGLDRPLVTLSDFRRVLGKEVRIFLKEPVEEKIEYQGIIESVGEDKMAVKTETKTIEIPCEKVNRAKQVIHG